MYLIREQGTRNPILRYVLGFPIMWSLLIVVMVADLALEIYHRVCFPLWGLKYVRRSEYIRVTDREKLNYLNWYEKIGCAYCGYVNGWLHYASTIAGRTENYFCALAHLEKRGYKPSEHEKNFVKYGDDAALKRRYFMHERDFARKFPEIN